MQLAALRAAADPPGLARLALLVALLCAVQLLLSSPARAQREEGWGYALANELMSPWCPGFALPDCSSGYASELRLWILEQERLGRTEEEVRAEILAKYGEQMLQAPSARGRGILAYAIPAALILAGGVVLGVFLRRQGAAPAAARSVAALDPALRSRVEAEIEASNRDA
jgi:cytochrome c-type biogenesis protein CcmH/NrfF